MSVFRNVIGNAELAGTGTHDGTRSLNRLLHDIAQAAGTHRIALARHQRAFDGQQFAADLGPGETGHLTDLVFLLGHAEGVTAHPR